MNIQTVHDALIALLVTVGIAGSISIAIVALTAVAERGKTRPGRAASSTPAMAQHAVQTDDPRQLVRS